MEYFRLLDTVRNGTIVRADGPIQHEYVPGEGWVRSGVMMEYFNDESEFYDAYQEISESEAKAITG